MANPIAEWFRKLFSRKPNKQIEKPLQKIVEVKKIPKIKNTGKNKEKYKTERKKMVIRKSTPQRIINLKKPEKKRLQKVFGKLKPEGALRPMPKQIPLEIIKELVASDIMTKKVTSVRNNDILAYAVRLLGDKGISGAPVLNRNGNLVGILTERDIVQMVGSRDLLDAQTNRLDKLKETKVDEIMRRNPITVFQHTALHEINNTMNKHSMARIVVLNEKREVVGIITRGDMVRAISKQMLLKIIQKPRAFERFQISTELDDVLESIEKKGTISVREIKQKLNVPEEKIEEWGRVLEKHNLIEVFYPPIGKPYFRKKVV